jgi:Concanavalin A-like lectin/glucanases superfamily
MRYNFYILTITLVCFAGIGCKKTGADSALTVSPVAPTVTTADASNITGTKATIGGNITNDGSSIIKEAGIVYSTTSGVDTSKNRTRNYTISGPFSVDLKDLSLLTKYYYKAYAINEKGITYGEEKSFFVPVNGYNSSSQVGAANLVGYWAFDGSLIDSVSAQSGTSTNTSFSTGLKKQSLQTGSNGYVLFTPGASITGVTSYTIAYWVNAPLNSAGIGGTVNLSHNSNFWGNIDQFFENGGTADGAKFRVHVTNGNGNEHWIAKDGIPNVFGKWTNLATSFDAATKTFKFYVNGVEVVSEVDAAFGNLQFANSGKLVFGTVQFMTNPSLTSSHGAEPWAGYLNGLLDEVKFFNKALTAEEIMALYALQSKGF